MPIATFVDIEPSRQDEGVELAIALAEFCNEEGEPLYLLCDAATALEIGASLLGTRESRALEGGFYAPSTLRLLPAIRRPDSLIDELASTSDDELGGGIEEFYQLGLFARAGEGEGATEFGPDPAFALEEMIAELAPLHVFGLGRESSLWTSVVRGAERARSVPVLVEIEGLTPPELRGRFERVRLNRPEVLIRTADGVEPSREIAEFEELQRKAEQTGALVSSLFDFLTQLRSR